MNRLPAVPIALLALAACSSDASGPGGNQGTSLSFTTSNPTSPQVNAAALARDITLTAGNDVLVITRVQLVLGEVELKTSESVDCDNSGPGKDPACAELELGPVLVDLPLASGVQTELSVTIPPGTYREIEFELEAADDDDGPEAAFLASNPGFRGISARIEGTFNGEQFVFTTGTEAEMEFHLDPAMVVGAGGTNVTVFVNVDSWFRAAGGGILDPRPATLTTTLRSAIEANIRASFDAFGDDDRDGRRG
jgi:hypothetical protein